MKDPKDLAVHFIKPYILRGDGVESIVQGKGGMSCTEYGVQIGGYVWHGDRMVYRGRAHEIIVYRLQGADCLYKYNIYALAKELMLEEQGVKQTEMFKEGGYK